VKKKKLIVKLISDEMFRNGFDLIIGDREDANKWVERYCGCSDVFSVGKYGEYITLKQQNLNMKNGKLEESGDYINLLFISSLNYEYLMHELLHHTLRTLELNHVTTVSDSTQEIFANYHCYILNKVWKALKLRPLSIGGSSGKTKTKRTSANAYDKEKVVSDVSGEGSYA